MANDINHLCVFIYLPSIYFIVHFKLGIFFIIEFFIYSVLLHTFQGQDGEGPPIPQVQFLGQLAVMSSRSGIPNSSLGPWPVRS